VRNELAQNLAPHLTNIPHTGQGVSPVCTPQPGAAAAAAAASASAASVWVVVHGLSENYRRA
jgi:hypothetical protein